MAPNALRALLNRACCNVDNEEDGKRVFSCALFFFFSFPSVRLPGDSRTRIGFLTFDSTIHFYNLQEGLSQPQMLVVSDIDGKDDIFFQISRAD